MEKRDVPSSLLLCISLALLVPHLSDAAVPAIFVLGDSTADVGTNTFLPKSTSKADFPYYGIDFQHSKATGRFSNGLNGVDFLAKLMGFKRSPQPFLFLLTLKHRLRSHKFRGVNFASGGSGLLDATGQLPVVVSMSEQIQQFSTVRDNLTAVIGLESTELMIAESFFAISVGSNDIFAYFATGSTVPVEQFITVLITAYQSYIKALYYLGARKFGIISLPPIGCCPANRVLNATGGCLEPMNAFARAFYSGLDTMLVNISSELSGMKYSLGNSYEITMNSIENPYPYFDDVEGACCGFGRLNVVHPCNATANLCSDRQKYLFWDSYHTTMAASHLVAETLYSGESRFVSPINFAQLAEA